MCASVHTEPSGPPTEAVSLRSELPSVADLAVEDTFMTVQVCGVQGLVAHAALETFFVEGQLADFPRFGGVYRFLAFWALDLFGGLERHFGLLLDH